MGGLYGCGGKIAEGAPDIGLVRGDYFPLMRVPHVQFREQGDPESSRALKMPAQKFQVPLGALLQLNREMEMRAKRQLIMSDLGTRASWGRMPGMGK